MAHDNPIREIRERYDLTVYRLAQILVLPIADVELLERHSDDIPAHLPAQIERLVRGYLADPPLLELPPPERLCNVLPLSGEDEPNG